jgi:type II secretory pathway predicted ATPase ExeA
MGTTQKHHLKINPYLDIISGITVVLSFSDGIIKIIGREGSGKSVLCQLLATELMEENQEVVIFSDIPHSEAEPHNPI